MRWRIQHFWKHLKSSATSLGLVFSAWNSFICSSEMPFSISHSLKMRSCLHCQDKDVIIDNAFKKLTKLVTCGIAAANAITTVNTKNNFIFQCLNFNFLEKLKFLIFGHIFGFDLLRMEFVYLLQRNSIFNGTLDKDAFLFALSG